MITGGSRVYLIVSRAVRNHLASALVNFYSVASDTALSTSRLDASERVTLGGACDGCTSLVDERKSKALSATGALGRDELATHALSKASIDTGLITI